MPGSRPRDESQRQAAPGAAERGRAYREPARGHGDRGWYGRRVTEVPLAMRMRLCLEDIVRGRVPLFDGLDALRRLAAALPASPVGDPTLADDRDLARLTAMLADVEHLPIGAARAHWAPEALARHDRTLMEIERRSRDAALYACRRLMDTLAARDAP
jgi:hypothetical protein